MTGDGLHQDGRPWAAAAILMIFSRFPLEKIPSVKAQLRAAPRPLSRARARRVRRQAQSRGRRTAMGRALLPCFRPGTNESDGPAEAEPPPAPWRRRRRPGAPPPQQPPPAPAAACPLAACRAGHITAGFSGGGFLLPYHLGALQTLCLMGVVDLARTPMAGASAGALVVASTKAGVSLQAQMDSLLAAAADCRQHGLAGRLRRVLKAQLRRHLPADAAARCSDGTCWIAVTQLLPRAGSKLYSGWRDREQLVRCLAASCHVPLTSGGLLAISHTARHKRVIDGGFSNIVPVPPVLGAASWQQQPRQLKEAEQQPGKSSSTGAAVGKRGVHAERAAPQPQEQGSAPLSPLSPRVDSTKGVRVQAGAAAPLLQPATPAAGRTGWARGGAPSAAQQVAARCVVADDGSYVAAPGWCALRICALPACHLPELPAVFRAPPPHGIAIAPGRHAGGAPWPGEPGLDAATRLALGPPDERTLWALFEAGRADAIAWAAAVGLPRAVLDAASHEASTTAPDALRVRVPCK